MKSWLKVVAVIVVGSLVVGMLLTNVELIIEILDAHFFFHKPVSTGWRERELIKNYTAIIAGLKKGWAVSKIGGVEVFSPYRVPDDGSPRVCIFMAEHRKPVSEFKDKGYTDFGRYLAFLYAKYHGYDFAVATSTKGVQGDRAYNWMKVYHLRTFMKHYDWILALDSDSYVHGFNMSIEYALRRFTGDEMFTGGKYIAFAEEKSQYWVNSGNFVLKPSPIMEEMFEYWWRTPIDNKTLDWTRHAWAFDQHALNRHVIPKYTQYITALPKEVMMNMDDNLDKAPEKPIWIKHWTSGHSGDVRNKELMRGLVYMVAKLLDPYIEESLKDDDILQKKKK